MLLEGKKQDYFEFKNQRALNLLRVFCVVFFGFAISSCTDSGCIEADDFGEYQTQTLEVPASANSDSCYYNPSLAITDSDQGEAVRSCFIEGNVEIFNELGESQVSDSGCNGLPSDTFLNICINQCINQCNSNISAVGSSAEPAWVSTKKKDGDLNGGVNITPRSEVSVRALGSVLLGNEFEYPNFFVRGDKFLPQSNSVDWSNAVLDLTAGKSIKVSFSGRINDASFANGGNTEIGQVGAGSGEIDYKAFNAARRLVAYVIEHPQNYDFDSNQASEKEGSINIPLLPDPNLWECEYTGAELTQSSCSNKSYSNNGYSSVNDNIVNEQFPVLSSERSSVLGKYGGMIRWDGDGLVAGNFDPFAGISCDDSACAGSGAVDISQGRIVGDLSSGEIVISVLEPSKISFKNLLSSMACNRDVLVAIRTSGNNPIEVFSGNISATESGWSAEHISLEPNQELVVAQDDTSYVDVNNVTANCGRALALKIAKYHDIQVTKSGLVSFAMLNGVAEDVCVIDARIINPAGSHEEIAVGFEADFYEYGDFFDGVDPLKLMPVPSLNDLRPWDTGVIENGSNKVFVRKGQIIRFSPDSWNQTWSAQGGVRQCGIGMAMKIQPRPALLCKGYRSDLVSNPACIQKYLGGELVGCEEFAPQCLDGQGPSYCPNDLCIAPVTCDEGGPDSLPAFTRTNCVLGNIGNECEIPEQSTYTEASCNSCSEARLNAASQSPYLSQPNMVQCYDLENYSGKVSNIPDIGFSDEQLADNQIARGASKLNNFNGIYGNIKDFKDSANVDGNYNDNIILEAKQAFTVSNSGRLKFMFLDGDSFLNIPQDYGNNTNAGDNYSGVNGFKMSISSYLEFTNGQWLEAILCVEEDNESIACRGLDTPLQIAGQSPVVELEDPVIGEFTSRSQTSFSFDQYGDMIRTQPRSDNDCEGVLVGDKYYCHTNEELSASLIRLSFKIKDPELGECDMNNPEDRPDPNDPIIAPNFNGIVMNNNNYRPSDCDVNDPLNPSPNNLNGILVFENNQPTCQDNTVNVGATCGLADGDECLKQYSCVSKYANNSGKYYVTVRVKDGNSVVSDVVGSVINPVVEVMDGKTEIVDGEDQIVDGEYVIVGGEDIKIMGQAERVYRLLIDDPRYQAILSMALIVMLTFYGLTYLAGMNDAGISDILMRMIKIGVIYLFVGPQGWQWFDKIVVQFFKNGTDYLSFLMASSFDESPALQEAIDNFQFYDKSILFGSVDKVFGVFFNSTVQKKMSALLFASIFGWAYMLLIYYGMLIYIYAVATAVLLYLTAQVFISVLFVLGPLFFIFSLFAQTKEMFDKWLSQLIGFSLQQIFLLTTLAFFNMMMYEVIKMTLGYKVCWDEIWTINIVTRITLMSWWTISALPAVVDSHLDAGNIGNNDGIPSFFVILFIWVVAELMLQFVTFMTEVASSIGGSLSLSSLSQGVSEATKALQKTVRTKADEMWKNSGGAMIRRADHSLFNSGKNAQDEKKKARDRHERDISNQSMLRSAGNKGVDEYKRKHGAELANMSKEKQLETLKKVKEEAMVKSGKKAGLNDDEIKRLANEKRNIRYEGDNIVGLAGSLARQHYRARNLGGKSIASKNPNTDFSVNQIKDAKKNTDPEGRATIKDALKKGRIYAAGRFDSSAPKSITSKEYDEATKQLAAEGEVTHMKPGTNWARSDAEKKKIRARAKKNRAESKKDADKITNPNILAELEIDDMVDIEDPITTRQKGFMRSVFGKRRDFAMNHKGVGGDRAAKHLKANLVKKFEKGDAEMGIESRSDIMSSQEEIIRQSAEVGLSGAKMQLSESDSVISSIRNNENFKLNNAKLEENVKISTNVTKTQKERSEARAEISRIQSDAEFAKQNRELKAAFAARNRAQVSINNFTKAGATGNDED